MMLNGMMGNFDSTMMGWSGFGWFGWIFMVLWWVLLIVGIVALIRWLGEKSGCHMHQRHEYEKPALDILKERYAKSEIDRREFEEKKKDLN